MQTCPRIRTRLRVRVGGHTLDFRLMTQAESEAIQGDVAAKPEQAPLLIVEACRAACESPPEEFEAMVNDFPLACATSILNDLLSRSVAEVQGRIEKGVRRYKSADRNPGRMAENLLAFQAYKGGDYTERQWAGAMAQGELIATTGAIMILMQNYIKAMSRR